MKVFTLFLPLLLLFLGQGAYAQVVKYTCEVEAHLTTHKRFPGTADDVPTAYLLANSNCSFYNMTKDCRKITPCQKLVFYPPVKAEKTAKTEKSKKSKSNKNKNRDKNL